MVVSLNDVAKRAGVGAGTVSRVINDQPSVSAATRAKVLAAIEELGYQPSRAAQALAAGRTNQIGVIVHRVASPSVTERLRGICSVLEWSRFDLVLYDVEHPDQLRRLVGELSRPGNVAGLIVISFALSKAEVESFRRAGIPLVLVDVSPGSASISIDDRLGGRMAAEHLIALGHRRIAFVGDEPVPGMRFTSSAHRLAGVQKALADAGLDLPDAYVRRAPHGRDHAQRLTYELLTLSEPPTAIVAASDTQAFGVLEAARAGRVRVPRDLSVVGFDDIDVAQYLGLTTIRQPLEESGRRAAELALDLVAGDVEPPLRAEALPLELVVRRSTGAPAGEPARWRGKAPGGAEPAPAGRQHRSARRNGRT